MTNDEMIRAAVRVHELWPSVRMPEAEMEAWYRAMQQLEAAHVDAAIEQHKLASKFPPTIKELTDAAKRLAALAAASVEGTRATASTGQYLARMRRHERDVMRERQLLRRALSGLPLSTRKRAVREAVGLLAERLPALAQAYRRRRTRSPVVVLEAVRLAGAMPGGELPPAREEAEDER